LTVFLYERLVRLRSVKRTGAVDIMSSRSFSDEVRWQRPRLSAQAAVADTGETQRARLPGLAIAGVWRKFRRLTRLGLPRGFPIVQFPNAPLIIAFLAGQAGKHIHGIDHDYASSVGYLAMTIWAYEELLHGVNWFRHLLGLAYVIILAIRIAHGLQT
jgi:hypothetical protein